MLPLLFYFQDGMGKLRITDQGLKLYHGEAEFVDELRANLIRPSQVRYNNLLYWPVSKHPGDSRLFGTWGLKVGGDQ